MTTHDETAGKPGVSYEEVRRAGRELIRKIYESPISKEYDMINAAKMLTLPVSGRTFLFDGETDMHALADFWIHEVRRGGKTLIERCRPDEMGLSPLEAELLLAHQCTRTSLFKVVEAQPRERQLRLLDLLQPERAEVKLTDVGMSASLGSGGWPMPLMIFFRLITVRGYEVTSGVSFVFRPVHRPALLAAYGERIGRVLPGDRAARRFVFFYQRQREIGENQAYVDAPGTT